MENVVKVCAMVVTFDSLPNDVKCIFADSLGRDIYDYEEIIADGNNYIYNVRYLHIETIKRIVSYYDDYNISSVDGFIRAVIPVDKYNVIIREKR